MVSPTDYLRLVADPVRLALLGSAARGSIDAASIADDLAIPLRRITKEVGKLVEAGLLTEELTLDRRQLREIARALPQAAEMDPGIVAGPWTDEESRVLSRFFSGSRLVGIPSQRSKRTLVLDRLAQEFEPGRRYTEREVNGIIQVFHPDYATLRRYLVDGGFLGRADGAYWRVGGRVEVP
jgi:hypothetical protein